MPASAAFEVAIYGANYSLWMVGRQARHGGRTCVQNYILSEAGGRGRRRCGVGREEDSDQRCQDRCPAIFISKIFSQKIWPKNWGGSSNGGFRERHVCGSGSAPPRPPFVQMKNTRGSFFPPASGGVPAGVFLSAGIPAAFRRRAPTVPVARCGITNFSLQKFWPISPASSTLAPGQLCRHISATVDPP
jgi:hypothetical protein